MNQFPSLLLTAAVVTIGTPLYAEPSAIVSADWQVKAYSDRSGAFHVCSADKMFWEPQSNWLGLTISMDRDRNVGLGIFGQDSVQWQIQTPPDNSTVGVRIDNRPIGPKHAEKLTSSILIKVGKEAAFLESIETGSVLSVDIGNDILKYKLTDVQKVFSKLERCVARAVGSNASKGEAASTATPLPHAVPVVATPEPPIVAHADKQFCLQHSELALYRPALDRKPAKSERETLFSAVLALQDACQQSKCQIHGVGRF